MRDAVAFHLQQHAIDESGIFIVFHYENVGSLFTHGSYISRLIRYSRAIYPRGFKAKVIYRNPQSK
jgi:hypothetical protein